MTKKTDREICDAATPGPWHIGHDELMVDDINDKNICDPWEKEDADYIAHFNPQKVAEMLNAINKRDEYKAENEQLKIYIKEIMGEW